MAVVEYIFLAEFDIDKGSSLRHAVPSPVPGFEGEMSSRIAELMLPDGAHNRMAESTTFILRPKAGREAALLPDCPVAAGASTELVSSSEIRCFSVARTRIDASRRRHADLKALAIASRMPFADMLRPALAAALDCYFESPTLATLEGTLAAFNGLDVSTFKLPSRTERTLLRGVLPLQGRSAAFLYPPSLPAFLASADTANAAAAAAAGAGAASGGVVSPSAAAAAAAVAAATGQPLPAAVTGSPTEADGAAAAQREAHWFWSPSFTLTLPASPAAATADTSDVSSLASADAVSPTAACSTVRLAFRYPRFLEPSAFHSASLAALMRRFGDRITDIMAAVLLEKRVLFLGGRDVPAADVCACVLATAHMVCPPLSGAALSSRLYPYANLTDLSFLDTKGYIAGVTNPLFETKTGWFDVLCVLSGDGSGGSAGGVIEVGAGGGGASAVPGGAALGIAYASAGSGGPIGGGRPILPTGAGMPHAAGTGFAATSHAASGLAAAPGSGGSGSSGVTPPVPVPSSVAFSPAGEAFFAGMRTAATRDADAAFLASIRSGARFGEQWLRQAFQAHASHWVQLAGLHELIVGGRSGRARTSTFGGSLAAASAAAAASDTAGVAGLGIEGEVAADGEAKLSSHLKPLAEEESQGSGSGVGDADAEDAATGLMSPQSPSESTAGSLQSPASSSVSAGGSGSGVSDAPATWQALRSRADSAAWTSSSASGGGARSSFSAGGSGALGLAGLGGLASPTHRSYPLLVSAAQRAQVLGASARLRALAATATYEATRRERAAEEMAISLGEQPMLYADGNHCDDGNDGDVSAETPTADATSAEASIAAAGSQTVDCALLRSIARLLRQPGVLARTAPDCESVGAAAVAPLNTGSTTAPAGTLADHHDAAHEAATLRVSLAAMPLPFSPSSSSTAGAGASVAAAAAAITGLPSAVGAAAAGSSSTSQLAGDIAALLRLSGSRSGRVSGSDSGSGSASAHPAAAAAAPAPAAGTIASADDSSSVAAAATAATGQNSAQAQSQAQAPCPLRLFTDLHASLRGNRAAQVYFLSCMLADGSLPATGEVGGSSVGNGMAGGGEGGLGIGGIAGGSAGLHPLASGALHASPGVRAAARAIMKELASHPWLPVRAALASSNSELLRVVRSE